MQVGVLFNTPSDSVYRDSRASVRTQGGLVGAVERAPQRVPTSNMGGFVVHDRQPPVRPPAPSPAPVLVSSTTRSPPSHAVPLDPALLHALHRSYFSVSEKDGILQNTICDTLPAVLLPSDSPIPMSELPSSTVVNLATDDICVCEWSSPDELEQQLLQPIDEPYVLALPHNAVVLRTISPTDLPESCDVLVMGTLQPRFPYQGACLREMQRAAASDKSSSTCWWCPHMGAWLGRTKVVRQLAQLHLPVREWTSHMHTRWSTQAQVDERCTLFQDLSLAHPLLEGMFPQAPPLPLSIVIFSGRRPQYACRAACQYHSLGYQDIVVCASDFAFPEHDIPWARVVHADGMDGCLLQALATSQPTILLHDDSVVPSAVTLRKLHQLWTAAPQCLHSLSGLRWSRGKFEPLDTGAVTVPCDIIDMSCAMLSRDAIAAYLRLIGDLYPYHALTKRQHPEVALSFAARGPHQAHPKLHTTLECDVPDEPASLTPQADLIYDAWVQQCAQWRDKQKHTASSTLEERS